MSEPLDFEKLEKIALERDWTLPTRMALISHVKWIRAELVRERSKRMVDAANQDQEVTSLRQRLSESEARRVEMRGALELYKNAKNFSGVYRDDQGEIITETEDIEGDVTELVDGMYQDFGMHAEEILAADSETPSALMGVLREVEDQLASWVEYFDAISEKEVGSPREQIRTFELILLDSSKKALASLRRAIGEGEK